MGKYISSHGKSNNFRSKNQTGYSDNHTMNISYMTSSLFSAALTVDLKRDKYNNYPLFSAFLFRRYFLWTQTTTVTDVSFKSRPITLSVLIYIMFTLKNFHFVSSSYRFHGESYSDSTLF